MSVEDVLAKAGLTHGAFYAHFDSKDDLVREAIAHAAEQTLQRFSKNLESVPQEDRFAAAVAYMSPQHLAHPEVGYPVAALAPEVTRAGGKTKRALGESIRARIEWMRTLLPRGLRGAKQDEMLVGTVACMLGAVVLARLLAKRTAIRSWSAPAPSWTETVGRRRARASSARQPAAKPPALSSRRSRNPGRAWPPPRPLALGLLSAGWRPRARGLRQRIARASGFGAAWR
jgi:TetR/AcrR family transcriptional repressor of nem operon